MQTSKKVLCALVLAASLSTGLGASNFSINSENILGWTATSTITMGAGLFLAKLEEIHPATACLLLGAAELFGPVALKDDDCYGLPTKFQTVGALLSYGGIVGTTFRLTDDSACGFTMAGGLLIGSLFLKDKAAKWLRPSNESE